MARSCRRLFGTQKPVGKLCRRYRIFGGRIRGKQAADIFGKVSAFRPYIAAVYCRAFAVCRAAFRFRKAAHIKFSMKFQYDITRRSK